MKRKQFRLRTLIFLIPVVCAIFAAVGAKIRQDAIRREAFRELAIIGFRSRIGEPGGLQFRYERPQPLGRDDAERAIRHLDGLRRNYDLGFSDGNEIGLIVFVDSQQDEGVIKHFKSRFPMAEVRP